MAKLKWQIKRYGQFWLLRSPSHATGITYSSFDTAFAVLQFHLRVGHKELSNEWMESGVAMSRLADWAEYGKA